MEDDKKPLKAHQPLLSDGSILVTESTSGLRAIPSFLRPEHPTKLADLDALGLENVDDFDVDLDLNGTSNNNDLLIQTMQAPSHSADTTTTTDDTSEDVDAVKKLHVELQLEMLRGKLTRRNKIIEVIRRAYYHDVILVKEELRHRGLSNFVVDEDASTNRLSGVPSIDLRDVLPLFAPAETVLKVHPCASCGGHLELVHGESKELMAARQEMVRATKGEQQMKSVVNRLRTEAKEMEEVNEALQQRLKALTKENAYTLEQLQAARKTERDQKNTIATLKSKLQVAQGTQDEIDRLASELKDTKQQLIRSNHERDIFSATNNHLKEELAELNKAFHQCKVEKAQLESDFGTSYYKLQEEIKKSKQLSDELTTARFLLKEKITLNDDLQHSLTSLKEELVSTLQRFEQTKRHLEDRLVEEERSREELQEQNLELRKINKKLTKDIEQMQRNAFMLGNPNGKLPVDNHAIKEAQQAAAQEVRNAMRKKVDDLQLQVERANLRENDLLGFITRQQATARAQTQPMRRKMSRMPSTTVITRFLPSDTSSTGNDTNALDGHTDYPLLRRHSRGLNAPPVMTDRLDSGTGTGTSSRRERGPLGDETDDLQTQMTINDLDEEHHDRFEMLGDLNEKNFELYLQEMHRMLSDLDEVREKNQKQQKIILEWEKKHQILTDRLDELKLTIEALTGSVHALKLRLNQDSAGAAEQLELMCRQIDESKRDLDFENERGSVLMQFLRAVSDDVFRLSDNQTLLQAIELERPPPIEDDPPTPDDQNHTDSMLSADLVQKKRELRRRIQMDKAMKKFHQLCHSRAEIIQVELRKVVDGATRLREDLDLAENKIDSDTLTLRTMEAEIAKLRLTVEMGKNNIMRGEKALKAVSEQLQATVERCESQKKQLEEMTEELDAVKEDQRRLTLLLFEKTKAWEKEINANDRCNQKIQQLQETIVDLTGERDKLQAQLQAIEDLAEFRRRTNRNVEIMAVPEINETAMQTDRWRPQGLILRQRNAPEQLPQRYLGKASVMIACPELSQLPSPVGHRNGGPPLASVNQEVLSSRSTETDEQTRSMMELILYPAAKAGGRQLKTSHAATRTKAMSRLYLSADGISRRYIAPSPRDEAFQQTGTATATSTGERKQEEDGNPLSGFASRPLTSA